MPDGQPTALTTAVADAVLARLQTADFTGTPLADAEIVRAAGAADEKHRLPTRLVRVLALQSETAEPTLSSRETTTVAVQVELLAKLARTEGPAGDVSSRDPASIDPLSLELQRLADTLRLRGLPLLGTDPATGAAYGTAMYAGRREVTDADPDLLRNNVFAGGFRVLYQVVR
ncbi:MAG: hypothetical protein AAF532_03520 [Planctomycetota bacterium]